MKKKIYEVCERDKERQRKNTKDEYIMMNMLFKCEYIYIYMREREKVGREEEEEIGYVCEQTNKPRSSTLSICLKEQGYKQINK